MFNPGIAQIRRFYDLIIKIDAHNERDISGRREGRVLSDPNPLAHPIPTTIPPNVPVKFTDGKHAERIELLHVNSLRPTMKLRDKGMHVIINGDQIGTLVNHIRTQNGLARVFAEGSHRLEAFLIEKGKLCIVERPLCV